MYIKKTTICILLTRYSDLKKHTDWKQGNGKMILNVNGKEKSESKKRKKSEGKNTYVIQDRIKTNCNKRQRGTLNNDQNINLKIYNGCKYIYTHHRST